jgi:hypothetical protein
MRSGRSSSRSTRATAASLASKPAPLDEAPRGYEVLLHLPRLIPARAPADRESAAARGWAATAAEGSIVARFVRALADLGAYRTLEALEAVSVEAELL